MNAETTASTPSRLLLIEGNTSDAQLLRTMLDQGQQSYDITHQVSLSEAIKECGEAPWDLLLLNIFVEDCDGLETFRECRRAWPDVPLVVLSEVSDETAARLAVKEGAQDYLVKGAINARALLRVVEYSISRHSAAAERRLLVKELEHSRRLEAIGQLAAGVAHEINTPTQYVSDNTRFLRDALADLVTLIRGLQVCVATGQPPSLSEIQRLLAAADVQYLVDELPRAIDQSLDGLGHITRIVRAMKEFSHPQSEDKTPTDLNKALQTTVLVAANEWKYVAEVETDLAPDLPLVECRGGEMNQVFLNLLVNAAHAIAETMRDVPSLKGRITISTRALGKEAIEIRIQDTGCGIRAEHSEKIFEQFFTTKAVGKGTGQGLAIARNVVVNKHGGTIHFESEIGRGTTFIVRLPLGSALREAGNMAA
jgi:signal transduction histidine kinase